MTIGLFDDMIEPIGIPAGLNMVEAVVYLFAIIISEIVTVLYQPLWGIAFYFLVMVAVVVHASLINRRIPGQLILSLALVPLIRIISLSLPLADIPQIWWYPIIYSILLVAVVVMARLMGFTRKSLGISLRFFLVQLVIGATGLVFGVMEYLILTPQPLVGELTWQATWLPILILLVFTGFVEELIFRGVLQQTALEVFRGWGIVYVSALFAVLHIGFLSWVDVIFVFTIALFFGWVVRKTGSLLGVTLSHGMTNVMLFIVAPFIF